MPRAELREQKVLLRTIVDNQNVMISHTGKPLTGAVAPEQQEVPETETMEVVEGLTRGAPDEGQTSSEERPPKGKRKATAEERASFAQAVANTAPTEKATTAAAKTGAATEAPTAVTSKIPPVMLHRKDSWSQVSRQLDQRNIRYVKASLISEGIQIQPTTVDDYRRLTRFLVEGNHPHHTFSLPEERQLRVVIRGRPDGISSEVIREDLENQGLTVHAVEGLICRRTKRSMPLVLVKLPQDQEKALEVTRCCSLVVRAERQRTKANAQVRLNTSSVGATIAPTSVARRATNRPSAQTGRAHTRQATGAARAAKAARSHQGEGDAKAGASKEDNYQPGGGKF